MREIKFRGKRIDNGEWAYGYYAVHKMMLTGEMDYFIIVNEQRPQSIDPETVGQYTGLKDKNSVEIYEGDVILAFLTGEHFEVFWDVIGGGFLFNNTDQEKAKTGGIDYYEFEDGCGSYGFEVISNIYENADFLKG